jgi:hypothetical protein
MVGGCNGWEGDGDVKQARKKRILAQWAPLSSCTTAAQAHAVAFWNRIALELEG